jgi:hypothetical protein
MKTIQISKATTQILKFLSALIFILVISPNQIFATKITVQQIDLQNSHKNIAKLRIYASQPFVTYSAIAGDNNKIIQSGAPPSGSFYLEVTVSYPIVGQPATARIAQFDIDSTTDAQDNKNSSYNAYFVDVRGNIIAPYQPFQNFIIPPSFDTGAVATWSQISIVNNGVGPIPSPTVRYTDEVIDRKLAAINGLTNPMTGQGDIIVAGPAGMPMRLAATTDSLQRFLTETGPGNLPVWTQLNNAIVVSAIGYTPLNKAGDTATNLMLNANPTLALQAATKQYVDTKAAGVSVLNGLSGGVNPTQNFAVGGNFPNLTITSTALGGVGTHTFDFTGQLSAPRGGTGIGAYSTGDIIYANTGSTFATLSIAVAGNVLISGAAPSWGKVGLATHVSGLLPTANGGSGANLSTGTGYFKVAVSGAAAALQSTIPAVDGGTGVASYTIGDTLAANTTTTLLKIAGNTTTTRKFYMEVGSGAAATVPIWDRVKATDLDPTGGVLTFAQGGTGAATFAAGYIKSNGTIFTSQATPIPIADLITSPTTNGAVYAGASGLLSTGAPPANSVLFSTGAAPVFSQTPTLSSLQLSLTQNSIVFAGLNGLLSQNNSRFSWDNTNFRLAVNDTIRLMSAPGNTGFIAFKAPATNNTVTFTLPSLDGTNGQVLATNGTGTLVFVDQLGGGGGGGVSSLNGLSGILSIAVDNAGTNTVVTASSPNVTISIPDASAGATRGLMTNTTQAFAGVKTFNTGVVLLTELTLAGQTTTTGPLQFGAFTALMTTPQARMMENDNTRLYYTNSTPTRKSIAFLDDNITGTSAGFTGNLAGAISGPQGTTVYSGIVPRNKGGLGNDPGTVTDGYFLRYDAGSTNVLFSNNGSALTSLNATNLLSGTVPLAVLSNIGNTQISNTAAIAWSKLDKAGSSLADLTTRSAGDLSSGTLLDARLSGNVQQADPDGDGNPATGTGGRNQQNGYAGLSNSVTPKIAQAQLQEVIDVTDLLNYSATSGSGTTALLTTITSVATGQFITRSAGGDWINTPGVNTTRALTDGDLLKWNGTLNRWENGTASAVSAHNFLDSSAHNNTTTGVPVRGDIITAQGVTPSWTKLAISAGNRVLTYNGTDTVWGKVNLADANYITGTLGFANGGLGFTTGNSGGLLYFSSASTIASSLTLTNNGVVLGTGAGTAPTTTVAPTAGQVLRAPSIGGTTPTFGAIDLAHVNAVSGILAPANGGFDPTDITNLYLRDDFGSGNGAVTFPASSYDIGQLGWSVTAGIAGTTMVSPVGNHIGLVNLATAAASASTQAMYIGTPGTTGNFGDMTGMAWKAVYIFRTDSAAITTYGIYIGFLDNTIVASIANGIYLRYDTSIPDTNFTYVCESANVATAQDSGLAPAANTWYKLSIEYVDATHMRFQIDDAHSFDVTGVPTTALDAQWTVIARAAAVRNLTCDYFGFKMTGLPTPHR